MVAYTVPAAVIAIVSRTDGPSLALIGFGYWGPNYARVLSDLPGAELTVICDPAPIASRWCGSAIRAVATCEQPRRGARRATTSTRW